jgi:hypothetical protein
LRASVIFGAVFAAMLLDACSPAPGADEVGPAVDPRAVAEEMVAGELATTAGMGPLTPSCEDPSPLAIGTTFACTATTETGEVIQIQGIINVEGRIQLATTNLITAAALASFERQAAATLNDSVGSNFTAESVDCGAAAVIVPADFVLPCALIMPSSGEVFDLTLTITDLDGRRFSLVVADAPRA